MYDRHTPFKSELERRFISTVQKFLPSSDALVSISHSKLAHDYSHMSVYISIFPEKEKEGVFKNLTEKLPEIQQYLFKKADLKHFPKFAIYLDDTFERGEEILSLLDSLPDA